MDTTIEEALREVETGYQAALWKRSLIQQGVVSKRQYEEWLQAQHDHDRILAEERREQAKRFLGGVGIEHVDTVYRAKIDGVLWNYNTVVWAIKVALGETSLGDVSPVVQTFVHEVQTHISN